MQTIDTDLIRFEPVVASDETQELTQLTVLTDKDIEEVGGGDLPCCW